MFATSVISTSHYHFSAPVNDMQNPSQNLAIPFPVSYLSPMKAAALLIIAVIGLTSCKKMAVRHHCVCQVNRTLGSVEEDLGIVEKSQLGTYSNAKDTCDKMREKYNYTVEKSTGTETYTATCELD